MDSEGEKQTIDYTRLPPKKSYTFVETLSQSIQTSESNNDNTSEVLHRPVRNSQLEDFPEFRMSIPLSITDNVITQWLDHYPRSEILTNHIIYKPFPSDYVETLPSNRFISLKSSSEHNLVYCLTTYKNFLLIGLGKGQVVLYDVRYMNLIRTYQIHAICAVRQIIVGKKLDRFQVSTYDEFSEYSYFEEEVKFRIRVGHYIKAILAENQPIIVVDYGGNFYEYNVNEVEFPFQLLGTINTKITQIIELRSFCPERYESTRPCLLRHMCSIAIIDLVLPRNPNIPQPLITLWRKELLSLNPEDNIELICCYEKVFYAMISKPLSSTSTIIYASKLSEIGRPVRQDRIKLNSGALYTMRPSENLLICITRSQQIEMFDITSHEKKFHFSYEQGLSSAIIVRNVLIVGLQNCSIIVQDLNVNASEVCLHCKGKYQYESPAVLKRCIHFIPIEYTAFPISH